MKYTVGGLGENQYRKITSVYNYTDYDYSCTVKWVDDGVSSNRPATDYTFQYRTKTTDSEGNIVYGEWQTLAARNSDGTWTVDKDIRENLGLKDGPTIVEDSLNRLITSFYDLPLIDKDGNTVEYQVAQTLTPDTKYAVDSTPVTTPRDNPLTEGTQTITNSEKTTFTASVTWGDDSNDNRVSGDDSTKPKVSTEDYQSQVKFYRYLPGDTRKYEEVALYFADVVDDEGKVIHKKNATLTQDSEDSNKWNLTVTDSPRYKVNDDGSSEEYTYVLVQGSIDTAAGTVTNPNLDSKVAAETTGGFQEYYTHTYDNGKGNFGNVTDMCYSGGTIKNIINGVTQVTATKVWKDSTGSLRPETTVTLYRGSKESEWTTHAVYYDVDGTKTLLEYTLHTSGQYGTADSTETIEFSHNTISSLPEDYQLPKYDANGSLYRYSVGEFMKADKEVKGKLPDDYVEEDSTDDNGNEIITNTVQDKVRVELVKNWVCPANLDDIAGTKTQLILKAKKWVKGDDGSLTLSDEYYEVPMVKEGVSVYDYVDNKVADETLGAFIKDVPTLNTYAYYMKYDDKGNLFDFTDAKLVEILTKSDGTTVTGTLDGISFTINNDAFTGTSTFTDNGTYSMAAPGVAAGKATYEYYTYTETNKLTKEIDYNIIKTWSGEAKFNDEGEVTSNWYPDVAAVKFELVGTTEDPSKTGADKTVVHWFITLYADGTADVYDSDGTLVRTGVKYTGKDNWATTFKAPAYDDNAYLIDYKATETAYWAKKLNNSAVGSSTNVEKNADGSIVWTSRTAHKPAWGVTYDYQQYTTTADNYVGTGGRSIWFNLTKEWQDGGDAASRQAVVFHIYQRAKDSSGNYYWVDLTNAEAVGAANELTDSEGNQINHLVSVYSKAKKADGTYYWVNCSDSAAVEAANAIVDDQGNKLNNLEVRTASIVNTDITLSAANAWYKEFSVGVDDSVYADDFYVKEVKLSTSYVDYGKGSASADDGEKTYGSALTAESVTNVPFADDAITTYGLVGTKNNNTSSDDREYEVKNETTRSKTGNTVTNKTTNIRYGTVNLKVDKTWKDGSNFYGDRPTSLKFTVKRNGEAYTPSEAITQGSCTLGTDGVLTYTPSKEEYASNTWNIVFTGLPKYSDEGVQYSYSLTEIKTNLPEDYVSNLVSTKYSYDTGSADKDGKDCLVITNAYTNTKSAVHSATVYKIWKDASATKSMRPDTRYDLYRYTQSKNEAGEIINGTSERVGYEVQWWAFGSVDESGNGYDICVWVENLPKYDDDGYPYVYYYVERLTNDGVTPEGTYVASYYEGDTQSGKPHKTDTKYTTAGAKEGDFIVNTITDTMTYTGNKSWFNIPAGTSDSDLPTPTITLYRYLVSEVTDGKTEAQVQDDVQTDVKNGDDVRYSYVEKVDTCVLLNEKYKYNFPNSHEESDGSWDTSKYVQVDGSWELPKFAESGERYVYFVTESFDDAYNKDKDGYGISDILSYIYSAVNDNGNFGNTFKDNINERQITVSKTWNRNRKVVDENDKYPDVTYNLYRYLITNDADHGFSKKVLVETKTITGDKFDNAENPDSLTVTFDDLRIYSPKGELYGYYVVESGINGYEVEYSFVDPEEAPANCTVVNSDTATESKPAGIYFENKSNLVTEGGDPDNLTVGSKNSYLNEGSVNVTGKKVWNDYSNAFNLRPTEITVKISRFNTGDSGENIKEYDITSYIDVKDAYDSECTDPYIVWTKTAGNDEWTYTIYNLDKYAPNGYAYYYKVEETSLAYPYVCANSVVYSNAAKNGVINLSNITNTFDVDYSVMKVWNDAFNEFGSRNSATLTVELQRKVDNGNYEPLTATEAYMAKGELGTDYIQVGDNYYIGTTLTSDNQYGSETNKWSYIFENLPAGYKDGDGNTHTYSYRCIEVALNGIAFPTTETVAENDTRPSSSVGSYRHYSADDTVTDSSTTLSNNLIKTELTVNKSWDDNDNYFNLRPSFKVKVQRAVLAAGSTPTESDWADMTDKDGNRVYITLDSSNNWSYTLKDLPYCETPVATQDDPDPTPKQYYYRAVEVSGNDGTYVEDGVTYTRYWFATDYNDDGTVKTKNYSYQQNSDYTIPDGDTDNYYNNYNLTSSNSDGLNYFGGKFIMNLGNTLLKPKVEEIDLIKYWYNDDGEGNISAKDANFIIQRKEVDIDTGVDVTDADGNVWTACGETKTLAQGETTLTWTKLAMYAANGNRYYYRIVEDTDGYYGVVYSIEQQQLASLSTYKYVYTYNNLKLTNLTVNKSWLDDSDDAYGTRPDTIKVKLQQKKNDGSWTDIDISVELDLYKTLKASQTAKAPTSFTLPFTFNAWSSDCEPSTEKIEQTTGERTANITVTAAYSDGYGLLLTGLPEKDNLGNVYYYRVVEESSTVDGRANVVDSAKDYIDVTDYSSDWHYYAEAEGTYPKGNSQTLYNQLMLVNVSVTKAWFSDTDAKKADVKFTLQYNTGSGWSDYTTAGAEKTLKATDVPYSISWNNLPEYTVSGTKVGYRVVETTPSGYISKIYSIGTSTLKKDNRAGTKITIGDEYDYTFHNLETTKLTVSKSWLGDNNDEYSTRPATLNVKLQQKVVNSSGTVTTDWSDLQEITLYKTKAAATTAGATASITVPVSYAEYSGDTYSSTGTTTTKTGTFSVSVTYKDGYGLELSGLPEKDNNSNHYYYRVVEVHETTTTGEGDAAVTTEVKDDNHPVVDSAKNYVDITNYSTACTYTAAGGNTETLSNQLRLVKVTVAKSWFYNKDTSSGDYSPKVNVNFKLQRQVVDKDGKVVTDWTDFTSTATKQLKTTDSSLTWEYLPEYDTNGIAYKYRIVESTPDNYVSVIHNITKSDLTGTDSDGNALVGDQYSYTFDNLKLTKLTVSKNWVDDEDNLYASRPDTIQVILQVRKVAQGVTDQTSGSWSDTDLTLTLYKNGHANESKVVNISYKAYGNINQTFDTYNTVVGNIGEAQLLSYSANLNVSLSYTSNYGLTISGLPEKDNTGTNGYNYYYRVHEVSVTDPNSSSQYVVSTANNYRDTTNYANNSSAITFTTAGGNTETLSNKLIVNYTELSAKKTWRMDAGTSKKDVTFELKYSTDNGSTWNSYSPALTKTLSASANPYVDTVTWKNLPKYNKTGTAITYKIVEHDVSGFVSETVQGEDESVSTGTDPTYKRTDNIYNKELQNFTITKTWKNNESYTQGASSWTATFKLQQKVGSTGTWTDMSGDAYTKTITVTSVNGSGSYTWNNLPRYDKDNNVITYRAVETAINGVAVTGTDADNNNGTNGSYIETYTSTDTAKSGTTLAHTDATTTNRLVYGFVNLKKIGSYLNGTGITDELVNGSPKALVGAEFKLQKKNGSAWTDYATGITTDANGNLTNTNGKYGKEAKYLIAGTYRLVETKAPDNFSKLSESVEFTVGLTGGTTDTGEHGTAWLYTTKTNNTLTWSVAYKTDSTADKLNNAGSAQTSTETASDLESRGTLQFTKTAADGTSAPVSHSSSTTDSKAYFGVYADSACTTQVAGMKGTTDAEFTMILCNVDQNGKGVNDSDTLLTKEKSAGLNYLLTDDNTVYLLSGTYYIKELVAPAGYKLDSTVRTAVIETVATNMGSSAYSANIGEIENVADNGYKWSNTPNVVKIYKMDQYGNKVTLGDGNYLIIKAKDNNSQFLDGSTEIYLYQNAGNASSVAGDKASAITYDAANECWTLTGIFDTDKEYSITEYTTPADGEHLKSYEFTFKISSDDPSTKGVDETGKMVVTSTTTSTSKTSVTDPSAATGYDSNSVFYTDGSDYNNYYVSENGSINNTVVIRDVKRNYKGVELVKKDTSATGDNLENIKFDLYKVVDNVDGDGNTETNDTKINEKELITDGNGKIDLDNLSAANKNLDTGKDLKYGLTSGTYYFKEEKYGASDKYKALTSIIKFTIQADSTVTGPMDNTNVNVGTTFTGTDETNVVTWSAGSATVINQKQSTKSLTLYKKNANGSAVLDGAHFTLVYTSSTNGQTGSSGTSTQYLISGTDGILYVTDKNYSALGDTKTLPDISNKGTYVLTETQAPDYYMTRTGDAQVKLQFTLDENNQFTSFTPDVTAAASGLISKVTVDNDNGLTLTVNNESTVVRIKKVDDLGAVVSGAVLSVYEGESEDITDSSTPVATLTASSSDSNYDSTTGIWTLNGVFKEDTVYTIKETTTPAGYVTVSDVSFIIHGTTLVNVSGDAQNGKYVATVSTFTAGNSATAALDSASQIMTLKDVRTEYTLSKKITINGSASTDSKADGEIAAKTYSFKISKMTGADVDTTFSGEYDTTVSGTKVTFTSGVANVTITGTGSLTILKLPDGYYKAEEIFPSEGNPAVENKQAYDLTDYYLDSLAAAQTTHVDTSTDIVGEGKTIGAFSADLTNNYLPWLTLVVHKDAVGNMADQSRIFSFSYTLTLKDDRAYSEGTYRFENTETSLSNVVDGAVSGATISSTTTQLRDIDYSITNYTEGTHASTGDGLYFTKLKAGDTISFTENNVSDLESDGYVVSYLLNGSTVTGTQTLTAPSSGTTITLTCKNDKTVSVPTEAGGNDVTPYVIFFGMAAAALMVKLVLKKRGGADGEK